MLSRRRGRLALLGLLLTGCAIAPGMRMDEGSAEQRGRQTTGDPNYRIEPITQALVTRLVTESVRRAEPLQDPLAAEFARSSYTIAPHDVLQVTVWDHPELTTPIGTFRTPEENGVQVSADGTIFYPYVGTVGVAGKTVAEVRQVLTQRIASAIEKPQLDVKVAAYRGKRVQVTGEVVAPSTIPITNVPLRVQDALAQAKGFTPEADFSRVTLSRDGKTYRLDLQSLYEQGDVSQNWLLQDGDVVNVPDRSANKVFIMGEVRAQTSKLMIRGRLSLLEALSDPLGVSGGTVPGVFDPTASNVSNIYVIRGTYDAPRIYHLDASSADALLLATQFPLRPRDVVYVSTYELARFSRVMAQILPTISGIWQTYDIIYRVRHP